MSMRTPVSKEPAATRSSHQPPKSMGDWHSKVQTTSIRIMAGKLSQFLAAAGRYRAGCLASRGHATVRNGREAADGWW
jgi:hypothetical protein